MDEFKRLLHYARPYRGRIAAALAAMVVYAAGSAGQPLLVKFIVDDVLKNPGSIGKIALFILLAYFVKGAGAYVSGFLMADVGQRVVRDLRDKVFRHTLDQSAAFFAKHTSGELVSRITNDVNQVQSVAGSTIFAC